MIYFWRVSELLRERLKNSPRILLFLDYDGTLTPIIKLPPAAFLPKDIKKKLLDLSSHPKIIMAIISGRSLDDIKSKIGLNGIIYAGNHGAEWEIEGKRRSIKITGFEASDLVSIKKDLRDLSRLFPRIFFRRQRARPRLSLSSGIPKP